MTGGRVVSPHISWGKLLGKELPKPEMIIRGLPRKQVGMIQAVTNIGKTTLTLNLAICLAVGRPFEPLCDAGPPRRVYFMDYETPVEMLRDDIALMETVLTAREKELLRQNLFIYCFLFEEHPEIRIDDKEHWKQVKQTIVENSIDLVVVDPISLAFPGVQENDNTQLTNRVFTPLRRLVRETGVSLLFAHHIGKQKSEEGMVSKIGAYRSRGGSAYGGLARLILQLDVSHDTGAEILELSFEKIKGKRPEPVEIELDEESRWFSLAGDLPSKSEVDLKLDALVEAIEGFERQVKRDEIWAVVGNSELFGSKESLDNYLARGVMEQRIIKVGRGTYSGKVVRAVGGVI